MHTLVLLRHGESVWNFENRFTGWTDVGLSDRGEAEAHEAARQLKEGGYLFDVAYTSLLGRAVKTLWIVLEDMKLMWLPIQNSWRLNERHYGALQGLNKLETVMQYGEEQVQIWRRSYATPPPALTETDPRHPRHDRRYSSVPAAELPAAESLKDTVARFLPYWHEELAPAIKTGKRLLIAAHGNSLRALVKYLDNISDDEIVARNIPTGIPLVYELDQELRPLRSFYLGDPEVVRIAIATVAEQTSRKV